jgi:rhodanese-related sulfurtransferase
LSGWLKKEDDHKYNEFSSYLRVSYDSVNNNAFIRESISFLSELLYEYFGKKVYILVDEYDKPLHGLLKEMVFGGKQNNQKIIENVAKLVTRIVGGDAKGVVYVEKFVLTGIMNTVDKETSATFNGLKERNVMTGIFTEYFGFNKQEIEEQILDVIFGDSKGQHQELYNELYNELERWYKGYNIGYKDGLFTSYSVMSCLNSLSLLGVKSKAFQDYWSSSLTSTLLRDIIKSDNLSEEFKRKLLEILQGDNVSFSYSESESPYKLIKEFNESDNEQLEKLATQLLVKYGYLTLKDDNNTQFTVPGKEIKDIFARDFIPEWIKIKTGQRVDKLIDEFLSCIKDDDKLLVLLNKTIQSLISNGKETEADFQTLLNGIMKLAEFKNNNSAHIVRSEWVGVNYKKIDGFFIPKDNEDTVIIHEYKITIEKDAKKKLRESIEQIFVNRYMNAALTLKDAKKPLVGQNNNWTHIITRGICFHYPENEGEYNQKKWQVLIYSHTFDRNTAERIDNAVKVKHNELLRTVLEIDEKCNDNWETKVILDRYCENNKDKSKIVAFLNSKETKNAVIKTINVLMKWEAEVLDKNKILAKYDCQPNVTQNQKRNNQEKQGKLAKFILDVKEEITFEKVNQQNPTKELLQGVTGVDDNEATVPMPKISFRSKSKDKTEESSLPRSNKIEVISKVFTKNSKSLELPEFISVIKNKDSIVLDTRENEKVIRDGMIPGSINVSLQIQFEIWTGSIISPLKKLLLVNDQNKDEEAILRLEKIGYDNISGYLNGGFEKWKNSKQPIQNVESINHELVPDYIKNSNYVILDVRNASEWETGVLPNSIFISLAALENNLHLVPKNKDLLTICRSGVRSFMAQNILAKHGFKVSNLEGGILALAQKGVKFIPK